MLTNMKKPRKPYAFEVFGGRNRTRTCDPIDVNDVLWSAGQVIKLNYEYEHIKKAFEIKAFSVLGCVHDAYVQGVFRGVHGP